jgi:hypothetical protein
VRLVPGQDDHQCDMFLDIDRSDPGSIAVEVEHVSGYVHHRAYHWLTAIVGSLFQQCQKWMGLLLVSHPLFDAGLVYGDGVRERRVKIVDGASSGMVK